MTYSELAQLLAKRFHKENIEIKIHPKTANLTLTQSSDALFERNSFELTNEAKRSLQEIILILAEELFGSQKIKDHIESVDIVGHASPQFRQQFIDPNKDFNHQAYQFNLDLSINRAQEIVNFILSNLPNSSNHLEQFKALLRATGASYSTPLRRDLDQETLSKDHPEFCADFDCPKSRRVTIRPRLIK